MNRRVFLQLLSAATAAVPILSLDTQLNHDVVVEEFCIEQINFDFYSSIAEVVAFSESRRRIEFRVTELQSVERHLRVGVKFRMQVAA